MRRSALMFALAGLVGALVATPVAVYASHQFTDVSDSNVFHNAIDWMKDNNITVGCNPPANTKYCPDDGVTRGQMAAFLKRLSEGKVVDAATAVKAVNADSAVNADMADDADRLDGKPSGAFMTKNVYDSDKDGVVDGLPRAAFNSTRDAPNGAPFTLSTTITAPARGILILSGTIEATNVDAVDTYSCRLQIDDKTVAGTVMWSRMNQSTNEDEDCTTTGAAAVDAGTYTIDLEVLGVGALTDLGDASVWALWVPLDGTGATPASITQLDQTSSDIDERPTD